MPLHDVSDLLNCLKVDVVDVQVLLCTDLWKDAGVLHAAYHDSQGVTERFIKNGLRSALSVLGAEGKGEAGDWTYDVVVNAELQQVRRFFVMQPEVTAAAAWFDQAGTS